MIYDTTVQTYQTLETGKDFMLSAISVDGLHMVSTIAWLANACICGLEAPRKVVVPCPALSIIMLCGRLNDMPFLLFWKEN
jgi:hypothetical protein